MKTRFMLLGITTAVLSIGAACPTDDLGIGFTNDPDAMDVDFDESTPSQFREGTATAGSEEDSVCEGFYATTPQHILDVNASQGLEVRISGDAGVRLLLQSGQSKFCATPDDSLMRFFTRGEVMVFVGADEAGKTVSYRIDFVKQ